MADEIKPIKVKQYTPVKSFATAITIMGWGHVKNNGRVFIGRHRARCNAPSLGFGPEKCNKKLNIEDIGLYHPTLKKIHCKLCRDMGLWHESFDNELVFVHDKKTMEEQIIDILVEDRVI